MSFFYFAIMNTDKIISIAKKLDQQGKFKAADEVFTRLVKIAQTINMSESPEDSANTGGSPFTYRIQQWFGGGHVDRLKTSLKVLNAMVNAAYRVKKYQNKIAIPTEGFMATVKIKPFSLDSDTSKILDQLIKELREARDQAKKLVPRGTNLNEIDLQIEGYLNQGMGDLTSFVNNMQDSYNHIIYDCRNNPKAKSLLPLLYEGQLKLQQLMHPDMKIDPIVAAQIQSGEASAKANPFDPLGNPKSLSGWDMPKEFKVVKLPDSAPDIFGGTVQGSKGEVNRDVKKLSAMDDKDFADSYQLYRERIEKAFIANENKFSESEKANYENEMQSLKDRYYTILYRDKPKASFTD